jgi:hypothetical protein
MASKWPAPESQSACRVSNDRRQGLVINAKRLPRCALLLQESPPGFHKLGDIDGRRPAILPPICQGLLGGAVFTAVTKGSILHASNYCDHRDGVHDCSRQSLDGASTPSHPPCHLIAPKRSGSDLTEIRDRPRKAAVHTQAASRFPALNLLAPEPNVLRPN